ncbi:MAG TPA: cell division protein ZapA [Gemmatimonadaceae bacterium]
MTRKSVVRVTIVGEEYTIRSDATAEHTQAVAAYVDRAIRQVLDSGMVVESHRAAILAALEITDQLFQARAAHVELAEALQGLSAEVKRMLPPKKREAV